MGQSHSTDDRRYRPHRNGHHRRREGPNISGSPSQPIRDNNAEYGGICRRCRFPFDNLEMHYRVCPVITQANPDAFSDDDQGERPQYGREMHPDNPNFSRQSTMTPSNFDFRRIPLDNVEYEGSASSSGSDTVTPSYASQSPDSPPFVVSNARAWGQTWGFQPRREQLRPEAPFSEASSSSSEMPLPQFSERYLRRLDSCGTSHPVEHRPGGLSAAQAAQNQPIQYPRDRPPSVVCDRDSSTADSVSYSYITPSSLAPRSPEYISPPPPAPLSPREDRGREPNRPGRHSSTRSSSRQSELRSRNDEQYRESGRSRQHPPRSSATRTRRQESRDETPSPPVFRHVEARPYRRAGHGNAVESEEYVPRDGYTSAPRAPPAPSRPGPSHQTREVVFPGDRSQFSPSYLRDMGRLRFGDTGSYDTRANEGQYDEGDDDSDDHQFSPEYLREMSRIRNWRSRR